MFLNFVVSNQRLTSDNTSLVERTSKFIKCSFAFNEEWNGLNKVALFLKTNETIPIPAVIDDNGICNVPEKIAFYGGQCRLSVIGCNSATLESILNGEDVSLDDVIATTNTVRLHFNETIHFETLTEDEEITNLFIDFLRQINGLAQTLNDHRTASVLDHADGSITTKKLKDKAVTPEKMVIDENPIAKSKNPVSSGGVAKVITDLKNTLEKNVGDMSAILDNVISVQNEFIGGNDK